MNQHFHVLFSQLGGENEMRHDLGIAIAYRQRRSASPSNPLHFVYVILL